MGVLEDGKGKGYKAQVDSNNKLLVRAFSESIQHSVSHSDGQAYQLIGTANLTNNIVVPIHITNNSSTLDIVVTYVRHQILDNDGGTVFPNASNYFRIALGRTYSSGGTISNPININTSSANTPIITAYTNNPILEGNAQEIDRWHTKEEGDMSVFNKEGAVILGQNGTLELSYVGDQTSGIIFSRISFIMMTHS